MVFDDELSGFDQYLNSTINDVFGQSDLDRYLDKPILPRDRRKGFDVLGWWNTEGASFPILRKMARDVLAVLYQPLHHNFLLARVGRLLGSHRSRLQISNLKALMCVQSWLWNDIRAL